MAVKYLRIAPALQENLPSVILCLPQVASNNPTSEMKCLGEGPVQCAKTMGYSEIARSIFSVDSFVRYLITLYELQIESLK
jgi:hypothetical protein